MTLKPPSISAAIVSAFLWMMLSRFDALIFWVSHDGIGLSRIKGKAGWQIIAAVRSRPENCRSVKVQAIQVSEEGAVAYLADRQASGSPPIILPRNSLQPLRSRCHIYNDNHLQ